MCLTTKHLKDSLQQQTPWLPPALPLNSVSPAHLNGNHQNLQAMGIAARPVLDHRFRNRQSRWGT